MGTANKAEQRKHARIFLDIWADDDFRELLSPEAQHLYFVLRTGTISYAGVFDWRPARIAAKARGWTPAAVDAAGQELAEHLFIVIDETTEEGIVRSYVKHDELLKNPRIVVSMINDYAAVSSADLRGVLIHELNKLRINQPDLAGWTSDISGARVIALLHRKSVDPADFPTGYPRAIGGDFASPNGNVYPTVKGLITPKPTPNVSGSTSGNVYGCASTSTATTTSTSTSNEVDETTSPPKKRRATTLPENWIPSEPVRAAMKAEAPHLDLGMLHRGFVDYWLGEGKPKADWDATWRGWMRREAAKAPAAPKATTPAGKAPTTRERKIAELELRKSQPNPAIVEQGGLTIPNDHPSLTGQATLQILEGGAA